MSTVLSIVFVMFLGASFVTDLPRALLFFGCVITGVGWYIVESLKANQLLDEELKNCAKDFIDPIIDEMEKI